MSSPFDELMTDADAAVLASFGEDTSAILTPRKGSDYGTPIADPDRDELEVSGVFSSGPGGHEIKGRTTGGDFTGGTRWASILPEFWLPPGQVAAIPYTIRSGDGLSLPGRPDAPLYRITETQGSSDGGLNLILTTED